MLSRQHFYVALPFISYNAQQFRDGQSSVYSTKHKVRTTYIYIKSTIVNVPSSELGLFQPLSRQRVCPSPPQPWGGGHTCMRVRGWGSPNSDDRRKSLALCFSVVRNKATEAHLLLFIFLYSRPRQQFPEAAPSIQRFISLNKVPTPPPPLTD